jgi:hypothetical protein
MLQGDGRRSWSKARSSAGKRIIDQRLRTTTSASNSFGVLRR